MCIYEKQGLLKCTYANVNLHALVCRQGNESDAKWLEANFGPFSEYTTYSDLKAFNISAVSFTFRHQSSLKTAAHYSELGTSADRGGFAMSKTKAIHMSALFVSSGGSCGIPLSKAEG